MAGGNHPKSSHHNKPPPSASHRKSRWEPNSSSANSPADPKSKSSTAPSPKPKSNTNPNPSPKHLPFPFPDPAPLGPPPPPAYGFHMLERRTIVLADGSVRSYFALPPDYQDFAPRPLDLPPRFCLPDYSYTAAAAKRKYGDDDGGPRDDLARQREQLLRNANGISREQFSAGPSDLRPSKHSRLDGLSNSTRHSQVDQDALKKSFCNFSKLINENVSQKRTCLEDGKQGRLHCLACGTGSLGIQGQCYQWWIVEYGRRPTFDHCRLWCHHSRPLLTNCLWWLAKNLLCHSSMVPMVPPFNNKETKEVFRIFVINLNS